MSWERFGETRFDLDKVVLYEYQKEEGSVKERVYISLGQTYFSLFNKVDIDKFIDYMDRKKFQ
jgi:hypothetical protein